MSKHKDENTFATLKRLHELVRFLTDKGAAGAAFDEIADNIYHYNPEYDKKDSVRRKFNRDTASLKELYEYDAPSTDDGGDDDDAAVILKVKGRYRINSRFHFMMPMKLSDDQAAALSSGLRITEELVGPFSMSSGELWGKLQRQFSEDFINKSDRLMQSVMSVIPVGRQEERSDRENAMRSIAEAIQRGKAVRIGQYTDRDGGRSSCTLSPWVMFLRYHSWYVMGYSPDKRDKDQPAFRLDRMKMVEVLDEPQQHPCTGKKLEELKKNIRLDYNPNRPDDKYLVRLRITGSFVRPCMQTEWFPGEKKKERRTKDGEPYVDYEVKLKGLEWIKLWIMRALDCMEVLEPAELRDDIDRRVMMYCSRRRQAAQEGEQTPCI